MKLVLRGLIEPRSVEGLEDTRGLGGPMRAIGNVVTEQVNTIGVKLIQTQVVVFFLFFVCSSFLMFFNVFFSFLFSFFNSF